MASLTGTPAPIGQQGERVKAQAADIAGRLPPLLVAAERIAVTVEQGVHGRRRVGRGESFWQFRQYYPGDDLRRLDWRQSAKSDRLYLRQMEWSAAQSVYLWCDASPSMSYSSNRNLPEKLERARIMLLALATVLSQAGERIALLGTGEPPIAGRNVAERLGERLLRNGRSEQNTGPDGLPPQILLPSHAHVVLISDFLVPLEKLEKIIDRFADRDIHGHLLQVLDPAEVDLPFSGRVRFQGLETEGDYLVSKADLLRGSYRDRLAAHWQGLRDLVAGAGWSCSRHVTGDSPTRSLLELYQWLAADYRLRR
ncbi:MAG: DUF58 domain-containing protein [Rhodospirillaceae bacterium]|nr:MAG: DUF58 domain-containing protein [Rhodospirillaceae bacterium]